ncbi:uncharacterized protein [Henckelia pumila]|uniref:uncharacterized protein isoform X2 n=1 Tax=Henckelia pumila TaxID=405737 RepID=UPI003C6E8E25
MIHELQRESMDIDDPRRNEVGNEGSPCRPKENGVHLYPVSVNDSGEGLPYAPEDWPNPGDKWVWKVGRRINVSGFFMDRYLYLPSRFRKAGQGRIFANNKEIFRNHNETSEHPVSNSPMGGCKAGNRFCTSLDTGEDSVLEIMFCDICCSEPSFCRDCCCILCSRTINKALGTHNYIRCEATIEGYICGHNCHIDCALRAYMAGTVGGSIGLEAEYYCCRCDSRTDLVSHVRKLLQTCESIDSRDHIEKILNVGIRVLRGSKKTSAHQLLNSIDKAMLKLKNGTYIEDIWKKEDAFAVADDENGIPESTEDEESQDRIMDLPQPFSLTFDPRAESLKLEDEIDHVLNALRKSQELEYIVAEERLSIQKNHIINLYQQLDKERLELSPDAARKDQDSVLDAVLCRIKQIKRELSILKDMEEVSKGFGRVPKHILKEQFDIDV